MIGLSHNLAAGRIRKEIGNHERDMHPKQNEQLKKKHPTNHDVESGKRQKFWYKTDHTASILSKRSYPLYNTPCISWQRSLITEKRGDRLFAMDAADGFRHERAH
jgi:hypothetical protein